jgi:hypothetical protein
MAQQNIQTDQQCAEYLKAIGDPIRLKIIKASDLPVYGFGFSGVSRIGCSESLAPLEDLVSR